MQLTCLGSMVCSQVRKARESLDSPLDPAVFTVMSRSELLSGRLRLSGVTKCPEGSLRDTGGGIAGAGVTVFRVVGAVVVGDVKLFVCRLEVGGTLVCFIAVLVCVSV